MMWNAEDEALELRQLEEEIKEFDWHKPDEQRLRLIFERCARVSMKDMVSILVRWVPPDELIGTIHGITMVFKKKNPPEPGPSKPAPEGE